MHISFPHRLPAVLSTFFALLALAGCARERGPTLSAPEALAAAQQGRLTIVDIRTPQEWRQTGIAQGVERIDMRDPHFERALLARVGHDKNAPIALICRTGNRTARMQAALRDAGFTNVYHIAEGMAGSQHGPGWMARGLPMESCRTC